MDHQTLGHAADLDDAILFSQLRRGADAISPGDATGFEKFKVGGRQIFAKEPRRFTVRKVIEVADPFILGASEDFRAGRHLEGFLELSVGNVVNRAVSIFQSGVTVAQRREGEVVAHVPVNLQEGALANQ